MFGGFDVIRPQVAQDIAVDWFAVVDDDSVVVPAPWYRLLARSDDEPCLAAKRYKTCPWEAVDHEAVLWIDANMEVTSPAFAREALRYRRDGLAVWRHPRRNCIYTEAEASVGAESQGGKYAAYPIGEQVAHYRAEGHPERFGLFACGTVAWDTANERAKRVGRDWLAECERWSIQDQLSLPVVCRRLGVTPGVFPFAQVSRRSLANPWLRIHPHAKEAA